MRPSKTKQEVQPEDIKDYILRTKFNNVVKKRKTPGIDNVPAKFIKAAED